MGITPIDPLGVEAGDESGGCCSCCKKVGDKLKQFYRKIKPVLGIFTLLLYTVDVATDSISSGTYYYKRDYIYGTLTLLFIVLPGVTICINRHGFNICRIIISICFGPFMQFKSLADAYMATYKGLGTEEHRYEDLPFGRKIVYTTYTVGKSGSKRARDSTWDSGCVRLLEGLTESLPQAGMQMYIVSQALNDGEPIEWIQWVTIPVSLLTLSYSLSTNTYFYGDIAGHTDDTYTLKDNTLKSKLVFFTVGCLASTSRLMVCCLWSMALKPLWSLPIATEFAACYLMWREKRSKQRYSNLWVHTFPSIVLTTLHNSFTMSGLLMSSISLAFAVGGVFLPVPMHMAVVVLGLATVSFTINVLMVTVPRLIGIGNDWLGLEANKETLLF